MAGLGALAGCAEFGSGGASEQVTHTADPGSASELSAFTPNGHVSVTGTDAPTVTVEATKRTSADAEELEKVAVVAEVVDDTVEVRVDRTTPTWPRVAVDLDVEFPRRLVTSHVRTGNGAVGVTDTRGSSAVETGNGAVTVTGHDGYPRITSGNGDLTVTGGAGVLRAWTGNGAVDVEVRDIRDECVLGSGNGDLTARVAADLACTLDLDTGNGTVDVGDLAVDVQASWKGHLDGALNGGGAAVLRATTGNGDVTLRPLEK